MTISTSSALEKVARHSAMYSLVPLLSRGLSFAMLGVYTWKLHQEENGVIGVLDMLIIGLQQLLGYNLLSGLTRLYFEQQDERARARLVASTTLLLACLSTVVCSTVYLFRAQLAPLLLGSPGEHVTADTLTTVLGMTLMIVPLQLTSLCGFQWLQIQQRSGTYALIQLAKTVVELAFKIWFLVGRGYGLEGYLGGVLIGEGLTALSLGGWMLYRVGLAFDWQRLRPVIAFSLPLVPVGLCQLGIHQLDRRLLESFDGHAQVGLYDIGYKLAQVPNLLLLGPFIQIWQPFVFSIRDPRERARVVAEISTYAVLVIGAAVIVLVLAGRELVSLIDYSKGRDYAEAALLIPWVASGYVLWAVYNTSQIPLLVENRTGRLMLLNLFGLAVNIGSNLVLIPIHGALGAAISTAITFAALAAGGMQFARSIAGTHFELRRILAVLVCVALAAGCALWSAGGHALLRMAALSVILCVLGLVVVRAEERAAFGAWVRARLGSQRPRGSP
ncbi:MAG: lipopolysaccharide biosynthesis protein [Planctomycetes bacterium]|nr:lipopolysaccharide biosynthesis protein [Planctomycetota bacterium]